MILFAASFWISAAVALGSEPQVIDIDGGFEEIESERGTYDQWWGENNRITSEMKRSGENALALPFPKQDPSTRWQGNAAERRIDPAHFVPGSKVEFKASLFLKDVLETGEGVSVSFRISDPEWNVIEQIVFKPDGGLVEEWQDFTETVVQP
jgi:hypothetical protein